MKLIDIINRSARSIPWTEGEKIPWNDPEFSKRMLKEHLSQAHDAASRRFETIDRHVDWINQTLLGGIPCKLLDLGCGPGFYVTRLARLGHHCTGIDFSPASIDHARKTAVEEGNDCQYILSDLREVDFGTDFDFVMLIYGEFNTFRNEDASEILKKARAALKPGGKLLLELESFTCLKEYGMQPPSWSSIPSGLFPEKPHFLLTENFWNKELKASTQRIYIIDAETGEVTQSSDNHQTYSEEEIKAFVLRSGYAKAETIPFWPIEGLRDSDRNLLLVAEK